MIAVISSIIIVITSLAVTLVTSTPNYHNIMESDFMRSAKNNAYLYGWELAQLNVRAGTLNTTDNTKNISLGYLNQKGGTPTQSLKTTIILDKATGSDLSITVDKE